MPWMTNLPGYANDIKQTSIFDIPTDNKLRKDMLSIMKELSGMDIMGCITGSCMFALDSDAIAYWGSRPDIDVFVFTTGDMIRLPTILMEHGWKPGKKNDDKSAKNEAWKMGKLFHDNTFKKKYNLSTISLIDDRGIAVNITQKNNCNKTSAVLTSFDMDIVMRGFDIQSGNLLDMRNDATTVAHPNMEKRIEIEAVSVDMWVRQFDRVIKYYDRGFDTRPMAKFYHDLIGDVLELGPTCVSEKAMEFYENIADNLIKAKANIDAWLKEHKDD